jgi:hypothetical protein
VDTKSQQFSLKYFFSKILRHRDAQGVQKALLGGLLGWDTHFDTSIQGLYHRLWFPFFPTYPTKTKMQDPGLVKH